MNRLKFTLLTAALALATAFTLSCSDSGDDGGGTIKKASITGVSQKGPFVQGSTATLYELNDGFAQTGRSFRDLITDNHGNFEIKGVELVSPYAMLEASGFYRNEVTGQISAAPIALFAIADIREKDNVNVNILTHLEYYRVLNLVEGGKNVKEAKKQAQKEILSVFGISGDFIDSEDMSIFGNTEGDAALLAISVLLQGNLSEGEFSQRLTDFSQTIKGGGVWNNEAEKTKMANWASNANLGSIKNSILAWGLSSGVPDFEKYVYGFWIGNYGLGECVEGEVKQKSGGGASYICKSGSWLAASTVEANLGGCTESIQGKIDNVRTDYYYCDNKEWRAATMFEYDTYGWNVCASANEGEIKAANVSEEKYICRQGNWQLASYIDIKCSENSCLTFIDERDNQSYAYVAIGEQTWMAEDLNYNVSGSLCSNKDNSKCSVYGRLYDWATAMAISASYTNALWDEEVVNHRGICPAGWHLPTYEEWQTLVEYVASYVDNGNFDDLLINDAGTMLKATSGWSHFDYSLGGSGILTQGNGLDAYGFAAVPSGSSYGDHEVYPGTSSCWWTTFQGGATTAYRRCMSSSDESVSGTKFGDHKATKYSIRCIKD